ncbi:hypothetical protein BC831DRAFT_469802 [Entophlyctis helioformis]|nr:hypothetical protein BC831DRAFT_469802 [Entophlyctis helioformis]
MCHVCKHRAMESEISGMSCCPLVRCLLRSRSDGACLAHANQPCCQQCHTPL